MHQKLRCNSCGGLFFCNNYTTKLRGPIVIVECPSCGFIIERNFSAFVDEQVGDIGLVVKAKAMISLAQYIANRVGEAPAFIKKKKTT